MIARFVVFIAIAVGLLGGIHYYLWVRLARDPAITGIGNGDFALRPLAQAAMQYPEAGRALVEQARLNQIPDSAWPTLAASFLREGYVDKLMLFVAPFIAGAGMQFAPELEEPVRLTRMTSERFGDDLLFTGYVREPS